MRNRYGVPVLPLGFAVAVLAAIFMGWLSREVVHAEIKDFDDVVRAAVHGWNVPYGRTLALAMTAVGGPSFLGLASVVLSAVLYARNRKHDAFILVVAMAVDVVLAILLKDVFQRPRPVPYFDLPIPHTFSFPSGHSLSSLCFFVSLAIIFGRGLRPGPHALLWGTCLLATLCVGLSRIYLGVHYPSDVLGGFLVGTVWMSFVWMADHQWMDRNPRVENGILGE